jgi:predicted Zn-dependent peptidase
MPRAGTFPLANLELYQVTRLPNGLAVATAEMPYMTSASVGLWVGVGGRYEPPELNGVCHFLEHMLFKGTRKRTAKEISEAVEGIGGYLNAFTSEENTCFFSKASYERFDNLLEVLVDMFLNSTFETVEIDKERSVIKEELAMYLDQPHVHVQELLNEIMWPDHPLGRSLTGTERSLNAIKRPDLVGYLRRNYVTGNTLIAAAGNVRHEQVVKAVSRFAPRFPRGKSLPFLAAESQQTGPRLRLHTKAIEQTQLALGIRTCSRHDQRRYALRMLNAILGENMSSRLFQVVREENGLAYSISSSLGFFDDVGTLNISAGLESDNLQQTLKLIVRELRQLTEKPPGMAEVRRARDYLIGQIDLSLESTESQMMWLGEQILGYRRIVGATEIKERLSKVKPSDIRAVARDFLRPDRMNLALVSPIKSDKGLLRLLNQ